MAKPTDAICIIFDVGANTNEYDKLKEKTFYDEAKQCIESIVTQMIFTKPKDEISLFLIGTNTTDNHLNEQTGDYEHINHALNMKPISWDILKYIQNDIDPPSEITADWVDALILAIDSFKELDLKKVTKKIFLFTTFTTATDGDDSRAIVNGLKELGIELIVVTKNVIYDADENEDTYAVFSQMGERDKNRMRCEKLITNIVMDCDGILCNIDEAIEKLSYVDKKRRRRVPWKADLSIGSNIEIKIAAYIYVRDEKELPAWKTRFLNSAPQAESSNGEGSSMGSVEIKTERRHNDEVLDPDSVNETTTKGYMYGGEQIEFEEEKIDNVEKSLKCIGFTDIVSIKLTHLVGESIWAVVPQCGAETSTKRFAALLKAMDSLNLAIVARYAYRAGTAPKMMALFPDENKMLMYELHYSDSYVDLQFPALETKMNTPNDKQLESIDKLVDSMDLTNDDRMDVDDPHMQTSDIFDKLKDPSLQYTYRAIAHRALHPNEPMLKMGDEIMALLTPPKKADAEQLKSLFPLKVPKLTEKEKIMQNILKIEKEEPASDRPNIEQKKYNDVHEVGTIKPAEDFNKLLDIGEPFSVLSEQIEKAIQNLVVNSIVSMDEKVLKALLAYRETAKVKAPFKYNTWIPTLKEELKQRDKIQLWQSFINDNLGLITGNESEMSTVTDEEANIFYNFDDFNTNQSQTNNNDVEDTDADLFDDM